MVHWTFYPAVVLLLVFSYYYRGLKKAENQLNAALKAERELVLQDLHDWDQELAERFERGELTTMEALKELTNLRLTRLKVLGAL